MFSRSCRPEVFCKKDVPNFAKFTGKHLWQSLLFNIVAQALDLQLYYKKKLRYRCCPVNFEKFLNTPFFIQHFRCFWFSDFKGNRQTYLGLCQTPFIKRFYENSWICFFFHLFWRISANECVCLFGLSGFAWAFYKVSTYFLRKG